MAPVLPGDEVLDLRSYAGQAAGHPLFAVYGLSLPRLKSAAGLSKCFLPFRSAEQTDFPPHPSLAISLLYAVQGSWRACFAEVYTVAMAALGDMTPAYPGVAELTRQLDQEKIAMLSQRVDDLRNQNQDLKVCELDELEALLTGLWSIPASAKA